MNRKENRNKERKRKTTTTSASKVYKYWCRIENKTTPTVNQQ